MLFNAGTGGTVTAATLENQWFSLLNLIQQTEQSSLTNPEQRANVLSSSLDQDTYILSGTASVYCNIARTAGGDAITYPDPYVGATFTEGTGGNGAASHLVAAFVERSRMLMQAERLSQFNPNALALKFTGISWTVLDAPISFPVNHNALLEFTFENIPIESVSTGDGATIRARAWLEGDAANL